MKVLLAASEVAPIIKLGGLGDVIGSLPKALEKLGINQDVIVPYFPIAQFTDKVYKSFNLNVPFNGESVLVEVWRTKLPLSNVDVFLLRNDDYFAKGGTNAFANTISETEMFSFFARSVVEFIKSEFNTYDIVHCNDWHTGLITHILQDELGSERPATLFTIHNLMYQGIGDPSVVQKVGITPGSHQLIDWDISDGDLNLMQQGITASDWISTVSPSYAKEILTEEYGGILTDILQARKDRLVGILNGIDLTNPTFNDVSNWKPEKLRFKNLLQEKLKLKVDASAPLFSFVSRLDPNQKGLTIILNLIPELVARGAQFVLLGTGDHYWEDRFKALADGAVKAGNDVKGQVSINIMFDNTLAKEIYAGSDFLLAPSKYEPCGLIQMIAMYNASLPIVHNVGGLKDSVVSGVNGFVFDNYSNEAALEAVEKATKIYGSHDWEKMVDNALKSDFSWGKSAKEYVKLYERMLS